MMKTCDANNSVVQSNEASQDGVSHINIHPSIAKTELGKVLALWSYSPFVHPYYGRFNSIEGFWHFMRNEERDDALRYATHDRAYKLGRKGKIDTYPQFREDVLAAIYQKIIQNKDILDDFISSDLPFDMYYFFGPQDVKINIKWGSWILPGLQEIRESLKKGQVPEVWTKAEARYASGDLRR